MKLFGIEIKRLGKEDVSQIASGGGWSGTSLQSKVNPMLLSTVYRCVELISDSVGVLPLKIYKIDADGFKQEAVEHPLSWLLNVEPNEDMDRFSWAKVMTASALLRGNGYAYIDRDPETLHATQLVYVPDDGQSMTITWQTDNRGIKHKRYQCVLVPGRLIEPVDVIHIKNFSYDGHIGVSTLTHARQTISISTANEESVEKYFEGGQRVTGVLTSEGAARLTKEQKQEIYNTWQQNTSEAGGLQILPGSMKYQGISINPRDSQMLESREFQVIDICRFFGVSPVKAFDLSKSSYSTVEATQLQYLVDTVMSWITRFEQELNRKLLLPSERGKYVIEFDTSVLLRTDKSAQAAYWKDLFNIGAATPNEVRQKSNLPRIEGGDDAFVQVNVQTLKKATEKVSDTSLVNK